MNDNEMALRASVTEGQGGAGAEGQQPRAEGQGHEASPRATSGGLGDILVQDARATRKASGLLARGQRAKDEAEAEAIRDAAKAKLRAEKQAAALQAKRDRLALRAEKAERRRADRLAKLEAGRTFAMARKASLAGKADKYILLAVYGAAVGVALFSQTTALGGAFNDMLGLISVLSVIGYAVGAVGAVFLELSGLYFARQALAQRKLGRSAWVYRILTWALVALAAWFNYNTHSHFIFNGLPLLGILGAASSIIALLVYEGDAHAKARAALEDAGQLARPMPKLGALFNWYFPREAKYARRAGVANPDLRTRQEIIAAGARFRAAEARAALNADIKKLASRAVIEAARQGQPEEALAALTLVADKGLALIADMEGWGHRLASAPAPARRVASRVEGQGQAALEAGPATGPQVGPAAAALPAPHGGLYVTEVALSGPAPQVPAPAPNPAPALPPAAPSKPSSGLELSEDEEGRPDSHWVHRTDGGFPEWEDRLAELAEHFPPGTKMSRIKVKDRMVQLTREGVQLRHYWTSNSRVDAAIRDLDLLRKAGYPDPVRQNSPSRSASQANQD